MKILVIIPARKGSKGIRKKNLAKINGKPLKHFTFELSKKIKNDSKFSLTTDSKEIINYSKKFKLISSPFKRPQNLSKDNSKLSDAILHTLKFFKNKKINFEYFVLLQPTSTFRSAEEVNYLIKDMISNKFESGFGVARSWLHPSEHFHLNKKKIILDRKFDNNRQKFKTFYFISGAIYMCSTKFFMKSKKFINGKSKAYLFSDLSMIDIDEPFHLEVAKSLFKNNKNFNKFKTKCRRLN